MTLQEMSHDYAASADAIGERIRQLHQRALTPRTRRRCCVCSGASGS